MADISDQQYLLQGQYKDASNLNARIQLPPISIHSV
jgi:hypothetical protein